MMVDDVSKGIRQARYRLCGQCPYHLLQSPTVRGNKWSIYCAHDSGSPESFGAPSGWRVRDPEFMTGPDSNCPLGTWRGLAPIDLGAETVRRHEDYLQYQRQKTGPALATLVEGLSEEEKIRRLLVAVQRNLVTPEIANEIVEGLITPAPFDAAQDRQSETPSTTQTAAAE